MELSLEAIAEMVNGELVGDPEKPICGASSFDSATADDITFAAQAKFLKKLPDCAAGAVLVPRSAEPKSVSMIRVGNPEVAFAKVMQAFHPPSRLPTGIHPSAVIGDGFVCGRDIAVGAGVVVQQGVRVGDRVQIHPNAVIGNGVKLGDDVVIHPNVSILERCIIGNRTIVHAGTVIGSDGFGYAPDGERYHKLPQIGIVQIDDDVEIGACNTIDRAAFDKTWIKSGVKTDNMVHVAHNCTIGENTVLVAQVALAGSVTIGKNVVIAGQSAIAGHLTIGDRVVLGPRAGILKSVPAGEVLSGAPGMPHRLWLRVTRAMTGLPELFKKVASLEKRMDQMDKAE